MKNVNNEKLISLMIKKSQESFSYAIETYNKPNLAIKNEVFLFLICHAWEMLLKAYLLRQNISIFYKDKTKRNRTISLTEALRKVINDDRDPVRINLETIVGMRNSSQHLIIPEYSYLLNDLYLACVENYAEKLKQFFKINVFEKFDNNFMTIQLPQSINFGKMFSLYGKNVRDAFLKKKQYIEKLLEENADENGNLNSKIAISYTFNVKQVKTKEEADLFITRKNSQNAVKEVKVAKDINHEFPYNAKRIIENVLKELDRRSATFEPSSKTSSSKFNKHYLDLYVKQFKIKENPQYCYKITTLSSNPRYVYSIDLVQKIIDDITENPKIFSSITKD